MAVDSQSLQSPVAEADTSNDLWRDRAHEIFNAPIRRPSAASPIDSRGAVHKRTHQHSHSRSQHQADRLLQTITPDTALTIAPSWTQLHDSTEQQRFVQALGSSRTAAESKILEPFQPVITDTRSDDMSSLGFLLPSQYGASSYDSEQSHYASMDQGYIPPMRASPFENAPAPSYSAPASTNPELYASRPSERRYNDSYEQSYRPSSGLYERPHSGSYTSSNQTIPSISGLTHSPLPSPPLNHMSQYHSPSIPPPSGYDSAVSFSHSYSPPTASTPGMYSATGSPPYTTAPVHSPSSYASPPQHARAPSGGKDAGPPGARNRNHPQCWDHGCNGRMFSTFSNLLRHQREKSGTAAKSYCPRCGAEFTRTTARNGHLQFDKCQKTGPANPAPPGAPGNASLSRRVDLKKEPVS